MGRSWKRAQPQGPAPRQFLTRQNSLHWVMDMVFRDDECRVRTDQAPANFTTLKHMAHNLIRKAPGKDTLASNEKPQDGTTTSSKASSPHNPFTRFPCEQIIAQQAAVDQAKAQFVSAQAGARRAELELKRQQDLRRAGLCEPPDA